MAEYLVRPELTPLQADNMAMSFYHGYLVSTAESEHGKIMDALTFAVKMLDVEESLKNFNEAKRLEHLAEVAATRGGKFPRRQANVPYKLVSPRQKVKSTLTLEDLFGTTNLQG